MKNPFLKGDLSPGCALDSVEYKRNFKAAHPEYFDPDGLLIFTGVQGSGKTLSAVQYWRKVIEGYPGCGFCTNVDIKELPPCKEGIPYDGLNCLMNLENGYAGVDLDGRQLVIDRDTGVGSFVSSGPRRAPARASADPWTLSISNPGYSTFYQGTPAFGYYPSGGRE